MRCLVCEKFSWKLICKECIETKLRPSISMRKLACGLDVISFYKFSEIEYLLKSKYTAIGSEIFKILAKNSISKFAKEYEYEKKIYCLGIDENIKNGYSHTAVLSQAAKSRVFKPLYSRLTAKNSIKYAGKSLDFRLKNSKGFIYSGKKNIDTILIDDVITTGTTLCEAKKKIEGSGCRVLFALTLADAKEK